MPTPKARPHSSKPAELLRLKPGRDLVASTVEAERESCMKAMTPPRRGSCSI